MRKKNPNGTEQIQNHSPVTYTSEQIQNHTAVIYTVSCSMEISMHTAMTFYPALELFHSFRNLGDWGSWQSESLY